jgi:hypothetical protein
MSPLTSAADFPGVPELHRPTSPQLEDVVSLRRKDHGVG